MPINVDLSSLVSLREQLGAPTASVNLQTNLGNRSTTIEGQLIDEGEIVLDADALGENLITPGGLLAIGNTQITLHILEPFRDIEALAQEPSIEGPRFHISDCKTLERMRAGGRFNRYVSATKKTGDFTVRPQDPMTGQRGDDMDAKLMVCKDCLRKLNYDDYLNASARGRRRDEIVDNFELEKFFEIYKSIFRCKPLYTNETYPSGDYTDNWARISREYREYRNWTCECCNANFMGNEGLLHAHHKDGIRANNRYSNLRALCIECHKRQPMHQHMRLTATEKLRIQQIRVSTGGSRVCTNC